MNEEVTQLFSEIESRFTDIASFIGHTHESIALDHALIEGKDVDITAHAARRIGFVKDAQATVTISDLQIDGDNVTIEASTETDLIPKLIEDFFARIQFNEVDINDAFQANQTRIRGSSRVDTGESTAVW